MPAKSSEIVPSTNTPEVWQSGSDAVALHAWWARDEDIQPSTIHMDAALKMLIERFKVDSAVVTLADADGTFLKMSCGIDPLSMDCRNALKACAEGGNGLFVIEDIPLRSAAEHPARQAVRFYAGAPIIASAGGTPVGTLSLMASKPITLRETDRAILQSAALLVSAVMIMPHRPDIAAKVAISASKSVIIVNHDQTIEAVNSRFSQITRFDSHAVQHIGLEQLLCLDRPTSGAIVLGHALLAEISGQGMTRCMTKNGSTLPVEVLVFPLPDKRSKVIKTALLIAPLFSGSTDDFLSELLPREREELLAMHIAGLWALDSTGRLTKLTGAPIALVLQSEQPYLLGQRLGNEGVFDNHTTSWPDFYGQLAKGMLPHVLECSVTFESHTQWYSMQGYRKVDAHGTTIGYHGSFRDITEHKEREMALKKSEERLSLILKGTNDGAWDWDMETGQYYLSQRWWEMTGRTPESIPFRDEIWMEFIHPDDRSRVRASLRDAIANCRDNYQTEFRMQHQRGHYFTVLGRGHILYNSDGKAVRTAGTNVDLTQQRQAQSQIRLLQSCVESIEDVVIITHASPRKSPGPIIMYVNPAFETFTGYTQEEVIGKSPRILQGPLTTSYELSKISNALQEWKPVKVELANYKKNGDLFWVELEIAPVQAEGSDQFTHWIGIQRDITKRKLTELKLRESNERLNMAMEASGLGFWTRNMALDESFRDERWSTMLGYAPNNSPFKPDAWLELVHPDDLARVNASESFKVLQADAPFEREFRMRHRDGRWVWIQSRGKVIKRDSSGSPLIVAGTHVDVSKEVAARQITERLNAQLSRCLEHINVGVILQRNGIIRFVNSTQLSLIGGAKYEDIVGTKASEHILPGDVAIATWRQAQLLAGAKLPSYWFNCIHLDGHVFKALTSSTVIEWEGEPHILSTITPPGDIALLSLEAETNRSRFDALLAKKVEAEQIRIAHELHDSVGSQLAGIALHAANIKLLAGDAIDNLTQEADHLLAQIKKAADMTRGLARGLAPVDDWPGSFWRALEKLCYDFSTTKQVTCGFDMHGNFDDVDAGTGTHLYRITQEAISNAVRHGGAKNIVVSLRASTDQMTLCIRDDGIGFEAAGAFEAQHHGVGLCSMYARAKAIDAQLTLERVSFGEFCVAVSWVKAEQNVVDAGAD